MDPLAGMATAYSNFGRSVDISSDGKFMVVGAPQDSLNADGTSFIRQSGAAYVYELVSTDWVFRQKLVAHDGQASDLFGSSVAIDGDTIVVGASFSDTDENSLDPLTDAGAAYVFRRSGGVWT